ncbi:MAG: endo alpha-1,4 polygalactosaminidase [Pseudomonadota bacterium]
MQALILALGLQIFPISGVGDSDGAAGYWDWQLTQPYNLDLDVKVLALDGEEHEAETIRALNARGIKTVCYISVGTYEDFRDDADRFPEEILGKQLGNWPDERYLDVRQLQVVLPIMLDRIDACKALGYAAIEPDNMDGFENDSGFDLTEADLIKYVTLIAEYTHTVGMEIAQKNAPTLIPELVGVMDFMLVEDCFRYDFCWDVKPYVEAGKDVLAVEYTNSNLDWDQACEDAKYLGFHLLLKDREISAGGEVCLWD